MRHLQISLLLLVAILQISGVLASTSTQKPRKMWGKNKETGNNTATKTDSTQKPRKIWGKNKQTSNNTATKTDSPPDHEKNRTKSINPFRRRSSNNSTGTETATSDDASSLQDKPEGFKWWHLWTGVETQKNNATGAPTDEKKQDSALAANNGTQVETNGTQADTRSIPSNENNSTKSDEKSDATRSSSRSSPRRSQPQPGQVLFLGGQPMGMGMGGPGGHGRQRMNQEMRQAAAGLALVEIVTTLVGNGFRLWLLLWSTRFLANRQEKIHPIQHFVFERLNDRYVRDALALRSAIDEPPMGVSKYLWNFVMAKRGLFSKGKTGLFNLPKLDKTFVKTVLVLEFGQDANGNLNLNHFSDLVSFIISEHQAMSFGTVTEQLEKEEGRKKATTIVKPVELEVVLKVNSPGGSVASFGYAGAQMERLRRTTGITTTVCVDKYAASGGYMVASQADRLMAAPFATVGSVGVIMETLNFHDLLRQYGVTPLVVKAGDMKNPITAFGPVSKTDLELEQQVLNKVHKQFQQFTISGRPQLSDSVAEVCNGSVYMGEEALAMRLVDAIMTSDEYLMQRIQSGDRVLRVHRSHQSRIPAHLRFPTPLDILPHLKARVEAFISNPECASQLAQLGGLAAFVLHMIRTNSNRGPQGGF